MKECPQLEARMRECHICKGAGLWMGHEDELSIYFQYLHTVTFIFSLSVCVCI